MTNILDLQRRIAEVGRLRIGQQVPTSSGRSRPEKLDTWRVTSSDRQRIEQIARLYGGTVQEWQSPAGRQWEVITEADTLPVIVPPPAMAFSIAYELWNAGGCVRRCNGQQETISDGPCLCDPNARECDIHTRLSVMLRDVPGLGVYRIDSNGYYAAVELSGAVEIIQMAAGQGQMLPARLRLEQRSVKRIVDGRPQTRRFAVPVLDIDVSPGQLIAGITDVPSLPSASSNGAAAVAAALPAAEPASVEEPPPVVAPTAQRAPQRRRAPALPPTGIRPRTAAEAKAAGDEQSSDAQRKRFFAAFGQHKIRGLDRLLITNQIIGYTTPGREVQTSDDLTSGERSNIIDVLERLPVSEDEEDFSTFSRRLDRMMTAPSDADIDPDTGEIVDINQPTLNGDTT